MQQETSGTFGLQINRSYPTSAATADDPESESAQKMPHNESIARSKSRYRRPKSTTVNHPVLPASRPLGPQLVDRSHIDASDASNAGNAEIGSRRNVSNTSTPAKGRSGNSQESQWKDDDDDDDDEEEEDAAARERYRRQAMQKLSATEERQTPPEKVRTAKGYTEGVDRDRHREKSKETRRVAEQTQNGESSTSKESHRTSFIDRMPSLRSIGHGHSRKQVTETYATIADDGSSGRNIERGGEGIAPGIDAPRSAVNAGERKVTIKCNESSIVMPINPTTRAQDIIDLASKCLSEPIDPPRSILVESFSQLGLERPLRKYERIRDVLNSWDHDSTNSLIIMPAFAASELEELDAKAVPEEQPEEVTFHIYHSQRPGKWDKRHVTLRTDGQLVMAKKPGHEPSNLCHLSDFDIYSPTPLQLEKKIKPPKKVCFAVKSQQKSSMFLSTENFVHLFATNDHDLASQWYKAIQKWRSWYLVNVLGEGQTNEDPSQRSQGHSARKDTPTESTTHQQHIQLKSNNPYAAFLPHPSRHLSLDTRDVDLHHRRNATLKTDSSRDPEDATFSPTGLLGRTYSQRQQEMRAKEEKNADEGPFSPNSLLSALSPTASPPCSHNPFSNPSSHVNSRTNTMRSTKDPDLGTSGVRRSTSTRQKSKPLVDLTPVYQEPPQHSRKGHGVTIAPGIPLVEAATGPEMAPGGIVVPSATTWRRPAKPDEGQKTSHTGASVPKRSNTTRSHKHGASVHSTLVDSHATSTESPFSLNGLLSRSKKLAAQGDIRTGHGVASGYRHATKPLLDLTPQSQFAEGSLLRKLESESS